ncbi:thrombospondin-1 [Flavobacteriaceae bacterium UJ101]|nr:thrombospondin-1 [Flavobacteriaceae bacterium UJ101]
MNRYKKIAAALCVFLFASEQVSGQAVQASNALISPVPLNTVENKGTGLASFTFHETSGVAAPASTNFGANILIQIDMANVDLQDQDTSLITGDLLEYFTVSYDSNTNNISFMQKAEYPASKNTVVRIPIAVTGNTVEAVSQNGFNVNLTALDPDTDAQGNTSRFTYTEANPDTDGDGIPDSVDLDDDNDGIPDSVEGYNSDNPDQSTDTDGDGTPDYLDIDTDNDGIPDLMESGLPQSQIDALDTDNDGVIDPSQEVGTNGIVDSIEPDNKDQGLTDDKVDYNDDGTNDSPRDTDGDNVGDWRDLDSDNDGLNDVVEGGSADTNGDGEVDTSGTIISTLPETDGDIDVLTPNNPNLTDTEDPDGDGVVEGTDTDGDGIIDITDGNPEEFGDAPFPDFTVQISSRPAVIENGGALSIRVNVVEITGNPSLDGKPVVVRIPEETFFDFNFNSDLTEVSGEVVNNTDWEYLGKQFGLHTFRYKPSTFEGLTSSAIGFEGTVDFEGVSDTSISAFVVDTSGGEVNFTNNRDTEKLNLKGN